MAPVKFTSRDIDLIKSALPAGALPRRVKLLSRILREWARTELLDHLENENGALIEGRKKRLYEVARSASELSAALGAIERDEEKALIVAEMLKAKNALGNAAKTQELKKCFDKARGSLTELASGATASAAVWKRTRGQPRNIAADLVLRDIARIYEWLTGDKATREVSRDSGKPIGRYYSFAAGIWPVIFGRGDDGLQAAMKRLGAALKRAKGTTSPVLANIAVRHPTWRIFGPS